MSEPSISNLGFWRNGERIIKCKCATTHGCDKELNLGNMSGASLQRDQLINAIRMASDMRGGTLDFDSNNNPQWVCVDHYHKCYFCGTEFIGSVDQTLDNGWLYSEHTGNIACPRCSDDAAIDMEFLHNSPSDSSTPSTPERSGSDSSSPPLLRQNRRRRRMRMTRGRQLRLPSDDNDEAAQEERISNQTGNENEIIYSYASHTESDTEGSDSEEEEEILPTYMTRLQRRNAENERIVREAEEKAAFEEERDTIQYKLEQQNTLFRKIQRAKRIQINTRLANDQKTIYDIYQLEDVTIANLLKDKDEDGNLIPLDELNIVFQQDKEPFNAIAVTKKTLEDMVYNPSYLNQTKYECYFQSEALAFDEDDLVFDQGDPDDRHSYTFINSRALGLVAGMFIRSQLVDIVDNLNNQRNSPRYFMYHITNMTVAPIIAADKVSWKHQPSSYWTHWDLPEWQRGFSENHTNSPEDMVSADHCQSLDPNYIIAIQPVTHTLRKKKRKNYDESLSRRKKTKIGGKRNRRRKKTHKKRKKGGMESPPPTAVQTPHDNNIGTIRYTPHGNDEVEIPRENMRIGRRGRSRSRTSVRRNRLQDRHPNGIPPSQEEIDQANRMQQRYNRHPIRNAAGDILEFCTGSRCGLGGGKKSRKKRKTRKKRTKKGGSAELTFSGTAEFLNLLKSQMRQSNEGAGGIFEIFDTDDSSLKKYYITKRHVESLGPDSNWIKMIELDYNNEPVSLNNQFPIIVFLTGIVEIRKKDGPWMVSKTILPVDQLESYQLTHGDLEGTEQYGGKRKTKRRKSRNKKTNKKRRKRKTKRRRRR